ncbi:metallophosphoesterase [Deinococcus taeanensis]|uniref:metallophosphoesterase n=1 Tax=Deinococcus taeanensis TaxID=2737050 RepID=UPI001CDCA5C8|nr:metallophosphoesterase [Deinococcus taeanensis]UBV43508.1 metallophosphoesterase [Deinococcus taeanensis]
MRPLWVVGDIHGAYTKLRAMLLRAGLIDFDGAWTGGDAHLVFLGDYVDRGAQGLEVIRLVRQLEGQAHAAGGQVTALLGNHEVMFMAALVFQRQDPQDRLGFREYWLENGGQIRDADLLEPGDLGWLAARPAMVQVDGWLLIHADSQMYVRLGTSVDEVNSEVTRILSAPDADEWGLFLNWFTERYAFVLGEGERKARRTLEVFGGERIAHGHTPVYVLLDEHLHGPTLGAGAPIPYANRLCLALDSGMAYRDDAGFIARLDRQGLAEVVSFPSGGALY